MKRIFNKYIIIILIFYAFWILGLPFLFAKTLPEVCENISLNTDYRIKIEKPRLILTPLPVARVKAETIEIKSKKARDYTKIEDFDASLRLLPLLSGKAHINRIAASNIEINSVLNKELQLDKNFFAKLNNTRVKCKEISVRKISAQIYQSGVKEPVIYSARDIYYKRNN